MRKLSKLLFFLTFAFGVAVSWAQTPDQRPSAQARLAQSIGKTEKVSKPNPKKKLITEVPLPGFFETPKNEFSDGSSSEGDSNSGFANTEGAGGSANKSGNGSGSGASSGRIVYNDDASASDDSKKSDSGNKSIPQIAPPMTPAGGAAGATKGTARKLSKWWPVCAFIDPSVTESKANEALKGMVDKAAECDVKIEVFPVRVKAGSWTDDHEKINEKTVEKCNLPNGLAGSTTALVPWPLTAARMCDAKKNNDKDPEIDNDDYDESVAGCAQLRSGTKVSKEEEAAMEGNGHHSHTSAKGEVAPSIEVPSGHSATVISHEALGHSQMGKPNGSRYGMGIGEKEDFDPKKKIDGPADSWSGSGCAVMRKQAHSNDAATISKFFGGGQPFLYDSSRTTYYKPGNYEFDMQSSPPLFQKRSAVPPPGPVSTPPIPQVTQVNGAPRGKVKDGMDKNFFNEKKSEVAANKPGRPESEEVPPEKHKKGEVKGSSATVASKATQKVSGASQPEAEPDVAVSIPTSVGGGKVYSKGSKVVFADSAPSAGSSSTSNPSRGGSRSSGSDDSVYESSGASDALIGSLGSSSGGSSGKISYNENSTTLAPGAGAMDSGPTKKTGSAFGASDSMSGGFGASAGSAGGAAAGGPMGGQVGQGSRFSADAFQGLGEGEEYESEEALEKRRKKGSRRPSSDGRGGRSSKPIYGDSQ